MGSRYLDILFNEIKLSLIEQVTNALQQGWPAFFTSRSKILLRRERERERERTREREGHRDREIERHTR